MVFLSRKISRLVPNVLAVKFGRMSKKQREKVEDEVRLHKQLAEQQGGIMMYQGPYGPTANGQ